MIWIFSESLFLTLLLNQLTLIFEKAVDILRKLTLLSAFIS